MREGRTLAIPSRLRDAHYKGARKLGHGEGYKYSRDYAGSFVPQAYLPEGRIYYEPTENGLEKRVKERLDHWRTLFEEARKRPQTRAASTFHPLLSWTVVLVAVLRPRFDFVQGRG